jgi:hypothetical protein
MRKDKLYLLTFFAITAIVFLISLVAVPFFVDASNDDVFELQIESSKREATELSRLIESQLELSQNSSDVIGNIQLAIQNTDTDVSFISVLDWSGKQIAHPVKTKVGTVLPSSDNSVFSINDNISAEQLQTLIEASQHQGNQNDKLDSQIILLIPVKNSDWIVAAHINMNATIDRISDLKKRFYLIFGIMGAMVVLCSFLAVRILGSAYEKSLEVKNNKLEKELLNISKLNNDLVVYQQKARSSEKEFANEKTINDPSKKRILTYLRDELLPIPIETIAYIYVENTITYVIRFDGKMSTTNSSLDELYASLDEFNFYRANRQVIIAVQAIQKIIKYGNNQLKIVVKPETNIDVVISKNKAAEFKQWLNL